MEYDKPIEVSESVYRKMMHKCSGLIAGREENGKFFIKLWMMKYKRYVESFL